MQSGLAFLIAWLYNRPVHPHRSQSFIKYQSYRASEALLAERLALGSLVFTKNQKLAIYFAGKLGMEEAGTAGREVYLQVYPVC